MKSKDIISKRKSEISSEINSILVRNFFHRARFLKDIDDINELAPLIDEYIYLSKLEEGS